jgi:sugar/nucleoside kinase (ribokinase family)
MKKIIGIGNALVDNIVSIKDDTIIKQYNLPRGGMEMIDTETAKSLHQTLANFSQTTASGGSTANTMHGVARLGGIVGYVGKIGKDSLGQFFRNDLKQSGIDAHLIETDTPTGIAITLMTPDSERTFATYLGAACELKSEDIQPEMFHGYDMVHVEGYLCFNTELTFKILDVVQKLGLKISMDLASYNLVELQLDFFKTVLKNYVDIIFANEDEARAFTGQADPKKALEILAEYCEIAVVKIGAKGSLSKTGGEITEIPAFNAKVVDTNGAGDIYAAGFLYGLSTGKSILESGKIGALLASKLVQVVGAKLSDNDWKSLLENELKGIL